MKRNLLLLAVMIWVAFGFSLAQAVQDPNDPGVADTLYLEVYPGDDGLLAYPADVKFPMFITNDIPNAVTDSIAGIVIPLCFTSTNAGANATIDIAKNNTNIFPFPDLENSIFQHLPTMDTLTATDRNFLMDIGYGFKTWATRELVLTGGTTFWVSLIPSGSADPRFPGGSRVLTATVTFTIDDSTNICLDTCFWPPTNRLAFARSDAVTYIPQIWDDYIPAEEVCVELYTVPNIPPVVNCPSNQSHSQNGVVNIPGPPFTATDTDGNVTTLAISFVGAGVGFEQLTGVSGLGTPSALFGVQYQVTDHCAAGGIMTITATDNQGGLGTCTFQVGLTNDNPVITCPTPNPADFYTDGTKTLNAQATATDANGDAYTFSAPGAPAGFVINTTTGAITWTPDVLTQLGAHAITLRATDACGAFHECIYTVNVLELLYDHEVHIGYPGDWEPAPQDCYVPGEMVFWPIIIRGFGDEELGGFDLHVDFDYTSMTFVGAERGELIPEPTLQTPGFEKFT
ncbi:MAG: putative Ig domain-containing protein, partial [Candidatus Zixiibacteriota bacterium]